MPNKKPMLILLATGTAGGKGTFISKIKKNQLLSGNKICPVGTDEYVRVKVRGESWGEMIFGPKWVGCDGAGLSDHQKKELDENPQVLTKMLYEWARPENVDIQALKQKINDELNEKSSNKIIIVEGMHALQFADIRGLADFKIWIQNDGDLRLIRKISRSPYYKEMIGEETTGSDHKNFGGPLTPFADAFECWINGVKPGEKSYVLSTKNYADLTISSNNWSEFDQGVDKVISLINLYFEDEKEFKGELLKEKKERIENEVSELKKQLQAKEAELAQLLVEETASYYQQEVIQQPTKN